MSSAVRKKPRARKCKVCFCSYTPRDSLQQTCYDFTCAIQYGKKLTAKRLRLEKREGRERLKTRSDWMKDAQKAFNAWIRARDEDHPCISCGTYSWGGALTGGGWDCSHYRSIGANPELRFVELNAHKSCKRCNRDLSGNIVNYRIRLQQRIGGDLLEWLEGPHEPAKYTVDDLKAICARYRAKLKDLKSKPGAFAKLSAGAFA
jgi:hypothetical protein